MKPFYLTTGILLAAVTIGIIIVTTLSTMDLLHTNVVTGLAMSSIVIIVTWGIVALSIYTEINRK